MEDWEGVAWSGEAVLLHAGPRRGSTELAPGCGIYRGGAAHAARLYVTARPTRRSSPFRGALRVRRGELVAVDCGLYQPAACSSAQVLGNERERRSGTR